MPRLIYPSSYECDCGHTLNFCEGTIWEMQKVSLRKRSGIGEGSDRHTVIFDKGDWVAIYCPKAGVEIPAFPPAPEPPPKPAKVKPHFTRRQGQVLAFIHMYSKLNRRPPAEADMAGYFQITAPSAHGMVETLTKAGLIKRQPGKRRSIELAVAPDALPALE
jgi:hypothetical protein